MQRWSVPCRPPDNHTFREDGRRRRGRWIRSGSSHRRLSIKSNRNQKRIGTVGCIPSSHGGPCGFLFLSTNTSWWNAQSNHVLLRLTGERAQRMLETANQVSKLYECEWRI